MSMQSTHGGTATEDTLVSLDDVTVTFGEHGFLSRMLGDDTRVRAVDGVSLDIPENDVVALVGESGCGKSTLGKTAIGLQEPTGGTVSYRGQDIWAAKNGDGDIPWEQIRKSLQIIHQDPGSSLNPNRTIRATLNEPLVRWRDDLNANDRRNHIHQMLETVALTPTEDYANRYPHQLSGGEKQRVALVRALLMNPDLILADEAVSALDVSLRIEMMDLMLELQDEFDTSYLFISHDFSNARYFAGNTDGRIGVMYLGEIVEIGPVEQVIQNPQHPYSKVLSWATSDLDPDSGGHQRPPVRTIDIPDAENPPSGCRFHTRCPEARERCREESPELVEVEDDHYMACFRGDPDHPYWDSELIEEDLSGAFQS